jgi:hypothetical protein
MATCPNCGVSSRSDSAAITVQKFLIAKPLGTWSVSGSQMKTVASEVLRMSCRCGWHIDGFIDGEQFCGRPETQHFPDESI